MSSAICINLDQSKMLSSGNGLKREHNIAKKDWNGSSKIKTIVSGSYNILLANVFNIWGNLTKGLASGK